MIRLSIFLAFTLVFTVSLACEDIRLDKDPNVLGRVPAWDQGSNGTCWAFSAAQLIDAWRFSNGDKDFEHLTSPIMVAVDGVGNKAGTYQWGNIIKAVDTVWEKGSCNAKWVSDHLGTEKSNQLIENLEAIHSLTQPIDQLSKNIDSSMKVSGAKISQEDFRKSRIDAAEKCSSYLARIGVDDKIAPGLRFIQSALEKDRVGFSKEILSFICKDTKSMKHLPELQYIIPPVSEPPTADRNKRMQKVIEENLKSNKPTAVNFCSSGVLNKTSVVKPVSGARCDDNSDHFAVIVGSEKKIFGKCKYLVRDSICSHYNKITGKKVCIEGQHWMTAEQLMKNTKGLIFF